MKLKLNIIRKLIDIIKIWIYFRRKEQILKFSKLIILSFLTAKNMLIA